MIRTAVILAAGEGRRNFPYTLTRQKAAIPVGNRPLIQITGDALMRRGIQRLLVVVGHRAERVHHALSGIEAVLVEQHQRTGTAPAVLEAAKHLGDEPFLVLYGDVLMAPDNVSRLLDAFEGSGATAAVLLDPLAGKDARDWICAGMQDGTLTGIAGHPRGGSHRLAGAFVLTQRALRYVEANPGLVTSVPVGGMPKLEADLSQSLQMMIDDGAQVLAVEAEDFVVDIDKPWHVLQANCVYARHVCGQLQESDTSRGRVSDGADIHGHIVLGEGAEVGKRAVIRGNAIIGRGTTLTDGPMVGGNTI
ncbi:MAG: sugar phosphate nucleotidyltransferase, partial [Armatimonadota bacterium]